MGSAKGEQHAEIPVLSAEEKEALLNEYANVHMNVYDGELSEEDAKRATELRERIMAQMTTT